MPRSHSRLKIRSGVCARRADTDGGFQLRAYSLILALSLSFGLPIGPNFLVAFTGDSNTTAMAGAGCALAQSSIAMAAAESGQAPSPDLNLKQDTPEPLEKVENEGIAGGASQISRLRSPESVDDNGETTTVLPALPIGGNFVVGGQGTGKETSAADSGHTQAIVLPGRANYDAAGESTTAGNFPSTATISPQGPLQLSLPNSEYILPSNSVLRGRVSETPERSPLLSGSVQTIPDGIKVDLTLQGNLNSEMSQKGSEVYAQISRDVTDSAGNKVYLPGGWVAHGFVTDRSGQKRHSGAGWAEVTFDRIISPDGKYDVPFDAKVSTKDNTVVAVTKILATDTKYMSMGAVAGGVLSFQMTGIGVAVASHGYSVAIGAAVGAGIGLFGAIRKKGPILSLYPGEHLKLTTTGSIQMPGFNLANLPSAKPKERVIGLFVQINDAKLIKDDFTEDKKARILKVNFTIANNSQREFLLNNLRVISELNEIFGPHMNSLAVKFQPLTPKSSQTLTVPFSVDAGKHQYWLLLTDSKGNEVRREPIKID
jgi:hypothetical protein